VTSKFVTLLIMYIERDSATIYGTNANVI